MRLDSQHIWKSVLVRLRQIDCLLVSFYCSTFYSTSGGNVVHNTCESNCLEDLSSLSCHLCKQDRHNMYEWCLLEFCVQKFGMSFRTLSIIILVLGSKSRFIQQSFPLSKSSDAIDHSFRHCLCSYRCMAFSCHVFPTMYSLPCILFWSCTFERIWFHFALSVLWLVSYFVKRRHHTLSWSLESSLCQWETRLSG